MRRNLGIKRRLAAAAGAIAMVGGVSAVVLASAAPAGAIVLTRCGSSGCTLFQYGPGNGQLIITGGFESVHMVCWTTGPYMHGTSKWFKVNDRYGTGTNWTPATDVIFQTTVGHC
jgi:hypothetical protein